MKRPLILALFITVAAAGNAAADVPQLRLEGFADVRILRGSQEESWYDGGLGKTRYGDDDSGARLSDLIGSARVQITEDVSAVAVVRVEDRQKTFVDIIESYVRYRPVSTNAWRFSVKAGAFFAPISLENTEIGWTSEWTLTPSAINSWVGNELRTIGAEAEAEWRSEARTISAVGALYGYNDPAGVLIAFHGWTLDDRPLGLIDRERIPDVVAMGFTTPPAFSQEILETDGRIGWYAGLNWEETGYGVAHVLYYDNRADPASFHHGDFGWRTRFWSVGMRTGYDDFVVLAQAMWGDTTVEPLPDFYSITDFQSAYVLAGWYVREDLRVAGRADWFSTRENLGHFDEDGYALTAAVTWMPKDWLRVTAEVLNVVSKRGQRALAGDDPEADELELQLSGRVYF